MLFRHKSTLGLRSFKKPLPKPTSGSNGYFGLIGIVSNAFHVYGFAQQYVKSIPMMLFEYLGENIIHR